MKVRCCQTFGHVVFFSLKKTTTTTAKNLVFNVALAAQLGNCFHPSLAYVLVAVLLAWWFLLFIFFAGIYDNDTFLEALKKKKSEMYMYSSCCDTVWSSNMRRRPFLSSLMDGTEPRLMLAHAGHIDGLQLLSVSHSPSPSLSPSRSLTLLWIFTG